jgi:hypothetical protein
LQQVLLFAREEEVYRRRPFKVWPLYRAPPEGLSERAPSREDLGVVGAVRGHHIRQTEPPGLRRHEEIADEPSAVQDDNICISHVRSQRNGWAFGAVLVLQTDQFDPGGTRQIGSGLIDDEFYVLTSARQTARPSLDRDCRTEFALQSGWVVVKKFQRLARGQQCRAGMRSMSVGI